MVLELSTTPIYITVSQKSKMGLKYGIVRALNMLVKRFDPFLQFLKRNFVVFSKKRDPKFLDAEI
jgi:hypothetical protein